MNILPLHPGGAPDLTPTPASASAAFAGRLRNQGVEATVRRSRGLDIDAACGQLRVRTEKRRRSEKDGNAVGSVIPSEARDLARDWLEPFLGKVLSLRSG